MKYPNIILVLMLLMPFDTYATNDQLNPQKQQVGITNNVSFTEGEVKKVDKSASKLTIKHGPIVNLDMPAMTMVFRVKEPKMLDQLTVGDKINFVTEKINGAYTVVQIKIIN